MPLSRYEEQTDQNGELFRWERQIVEVCNRYNPVSCCADPLLICLNGYVLADGKRAYWFIVSEPVGRHGRTRSPGEDTQRVQAVRLARLNGYI